MDSYLAAYAPILPAEYLGHFTVAEQEQDWRDWFAAGSGEILLVASTNDGELAGYALGKQNPGEIPPYETELGALHVRRENQRRGLGRQLFSAVSRALLSHGSRSLFLWTLDRNPARTWYEKLGGQLIAEKAWENNAEFEVNVFEVGYGWPDLQELIKKTKLIQPEIVERNDET